METNIDMEKLSVVDRPNEFVNNNILNPENARRILNGTNIQDLVGEINSFDILEKQKLLENFLGGLVKDDRLWDQNTRDAVLELLPGIDFNQVVPRAKVFDIYSSAVGQMLDLSPNQLDPYGQFDAIIRAGTILTPYLASSGYGIGELSLILDDLTTRANHYPKEDRKYILEQINILEKEISQHKIEEPDYQEDRKELIRQVQQLKNAGLTFTEIAEKLGEPIDTVVASVGENQKNLSIVSIPGSNAPDVHAGDEESIVSSIHATKTESKDGYLTPEQQKALNLLQDKVKDLVVKYLDQKQSEDLSPLVAMATGIGKGRIIHLLIEEQVSREPNSRILLIAGTKNVLVNQSHEKLTEYQQAVNFSPDEYIDAENDEDINEETTDTEENPLEGQVSLKYTTGNIENTNANVHLATIQTVHSRTKSNRLNPDDYDLVIVDEAHNIGTPKRKEAIDKFKRVAGFTATPHRNSGIFKNPEEYGFRIIESFSLPEAQNAGFVPPLLGVQINTRNLVDEIPTNSNGEINYTKLESLLKRSPDLYPYIADRIERLLVAPEGRVYKTIIAVNFVWEAEKMAKLLNNAGFRVGLAVNQNSAKQIHTEDTPAIDSVERYHLSDSDPRSIQILISPYVASEGFDAPNTEAVVWASPTQSGLRYTQFTGRLTRRYPSKSYGLVIDCLYQTSQHVWSFNMSRWFKENVRQTKNGLLYLGPENQMETIADSTPVKSLYQQLTQKDKRHTESLHNLQRETISQLARVQEADMAITVHILISTFFGRYQQLRRLADQVLGEMREDPETKDLIQKKRNRRGEVTIVTNEGLDIFLNRMVEKGAELKPEELLTVQKDDIPLTNDWLREKFIRQTGHGISLSSIRDQVLGEMREDPESKNYIALRINNTRTIPVAINEQLVIQRMVEKGARTQTEKNPKGTDAIMTAAWLIQTFAGKHTPKESGDFLKGLADEVLQEMREDPETKDLIQARIRGSRTVAIVTDKDLFIQKMIEKGARLKNKKPPEA
jgi:superfamily II DNA or RNA helicase